MTKITPDALIGAVVEDIIIDGDTIICVELKAQSGEYIELWANDCPDCECESNDIGIGVL